MSQNPANSSLHRSGGPDGGLLPDSAYIIIDGGSCRNNQIQNPPALPNSNRKNSRRPPNLGPGLPRNINRISDRKAKERSIWTILFLAFCLFLTARSSPAQNSGNNTDKTRKHVILKDGRTYTGKVDKPGNKLLTVQNDDRTIHLQEEMVRKVTDPDQQQGVSLQHLKKPVNDLSPDRPILGTVDPDARVLERSPRNENGRFVQDLSDPELGKISVRYAITRITPERVIARGINYEDKIETPIETFDPEYIETLFKPLLKRHSPEAYLEMVAFMRRASYPDMARKYLKKYRDSASPSEIKTDKLEKEEKLLNGASARYHYRNARLALQKHRYREARKHFRKLTLEHLPGPRKKRAKKQKSRIENGLQDRNIVSGLLKMFIEALPEQKEREKWNTWIKHLLPRRATRLKKGYRDLNVPGNVKNPETARNWLQIFRLLARYGDVSDPKTLKKDGTKLTRLEKHIRKYFGAKSNVKASNYLKKVLKNGHDRPPELIEAMVQRCRNRNSEDQGTFRFSQQVQGFTFPYFLNIPSYYRGDVRWPLVILLGGKNKKARDVIDRFYPDLFRNRGFLTVAPEYNKAPDQYTYSHTEHRAVLDMIKSISREYNIDHNRIMIVGTGMGASAAWDISLSHPERFAGIVSVSGGPAGTIRSYADNAINLSVYSAHGRSSKNNSLEKQNREFFQTTIPKSADGTWIRYQSVGRVSFGRISGEVGRWLSHKRRDPFPKNVHRVIARSEDRSAYWLEAVPDTERLPDRLSPRTRRAKLPSINAKNRGENVFEFESKGLKKVNFYWNPAFMDPDDRVMIMTDGKTVFNESTSFSLKFMLKRARRTRDRDMLFWNKTELR